MCFPIWLRVYDSIASCARKSMWTACEYVFISSLVGFKFWKVGSRKIFAVRQGDLKMKSSRKRGLVVISDSDSDDDLQPLQRKPIREAPPQLVEEVKEMRKDIQCLFQITNKMKISPGLYRQLKETFQCHICRCTPIEPPVIFTRCCHRILGCQHVWMLGMEEKMALAVLTQCVDLRGHTLKPQPCVVWMIS